MRLDYILFSQGFGTRRVCAGLVQQGHVEVRGVLEHAYLEPDFQLETDAASEWAPELYPDGFCFRVDGRIWRYQSLAYVVLNKPTGIECSQKPSAWPSVYTLLPAPLRQRPCPGKVQGVQAVGRLDQDTTGMLLLSDDGKFLHRMTSPKHHMPKVYEVTLKHAVVDDVAQTMLGRLLAGVVLEDDPQPVKAQAAELLSPTHLQLTLTEGKFHQVKRMVAAVGNRVEALHRSQIGGLKLPDDVPPGQWRWLTGQELQQLQG
jgi:16S rRNA pseudouridine516 synthase